MEEDKGLKPADKPSKRNADDDDVEIDIRIERPHTEPIDRAGDIFGQDREKRFGGINTASSALSKGVLFKPPTEE
ncbi:MAG: hypothetical protein LBQ21_00715 [Clostridiales Family XIII bacterium]|jgi:hypothetical protein|nr:hypothetical protein [Clostridiales Family XIII bacterium]